jgi:hypothetical protein
MAIISFVDRKGEPIYYDEKTLYSNLVFYLDSTENKELLLKDRKDSYIKFPVLNHSSYEDDNGYNKLLRYDEGQFTYKLYGWIDETVDINYFEDGQLTDEI